MAEAKTKPTKASVTAFLKKVPDAQKQKDAATLVALMEEATGHKPAMWGPSIVGFGTYHYKYESGREGDMPLIGFSPRKPSLVLYLMMGLADHTADLKKLGPHTIGKGCLYIKRLADVDLAVLKKIVTKSLALIKKKYAPA